MPMQGFDPEFQDLPDYIVKITERIWEGRGVGLIRRWYAEDCLVHTPNGEMHGAEAMVAGTLATLHAFPDRRLLPEDIIWSGDDRRGFLSSHRVSAPSVHLGDGAYGPPTGREVHFYAIADCVCLGNRITEEWLVRDEAGIAAQIGLDPVEHARRLARADLEAGKAPWQAEMARALRDGSFQPHEIADHPAARQVREALARIWRADLDVIRDAYHPACVVRAPGNRLLHGHARLDRMLIGWLSAFPDARFVVDHSIAMEEPGRPVRVSTRWWMTGTHSGPGAFGPPSGATVVALGVNHHELVDGRIRNEWMVADEVAIHRQIAMHRG
ncbi:ester cyclase [Muricoccus radiodurans]|uniref:ester cyclase n=1 Tax=Muricoccus radiodurans TaxID=2231721 RepID=UPI003CFBC198